MGWSMAACLLLGICVSMRGPSPTSGTGFQFYLKRMEDLETVNNLRNILLKLLNALPEVTVHPSVKQHTTTTHTTGQNYLRTTVMPQTTLSSVTQSANKPTVNAFNKTTSLVKDLEIDVFDINMGPLFSHLETNNPAMKNGDGKLTLQNIEKLQRGTISIPNITGKSAEINSSKHYLDKTGRKQETSAEGKPHNSLIASHGFTPISRHIKYNFQRNRNKHFDQTNREKAETIPPSKAYGEFNKLMILLGNYIPEIQTILYKNTDMDATEKAFAALAVLKSYLCSHNSKINRNTYEAVRKVLADEIKVIDLLLEKAD